MDRDDAKGSKRMHPGDADSPQISKKPRSSSVASTHNQTFTQPIAPPSRSGSQLSVASRATVGRSASGASYQLRAADGLTSPDRLSTSSRTSMAPGPHLAVRAYSPSNVSQATSRRSSILSPLAPPAPESGTTIRPGAVLPILVLVVAMIMSPLGLNPWNPTYCDSQYDDALQGHWGTCVPCDPMGQCRGGYFDCDLEDSHKVGHRCVPCLNKTSNGDPCTDPDMDLYASSESLIAKMHDLLGENMCETLRTSPRLTRWHMSLPIEHLQSHLQKKLQMEEDRFEQVWNFSTYSINQRKKSWYHNIEPHSLAQHNYALKRVPMSVLSSRQCLEDWGEGFLLRYFHQVLVILCGLVVSCLIWRQWKKVQKERGDCQFLCEVIVTSLQSLSGQCFLVNCVMYELENVYGQQIDVRRIWEDVSQTVQLNDNIRTEESYMDAENPTPETYEGLSWRWEALEKLD